MKRFSITHVLLFVTWCAIGFVALSRYIAVAPYQGDTKDIAGISLYHYKPSGRFTTSFDDAVIAACPEWHPADPNPPLSAKSALRIADRYRRQELRDGDGSTWYLDCLTLCPLNGKSNKWCWCVSFSDDGIPRPNTTATYILMNGDVLEPKPDRQN